MKSFISFSIFTGLLGFLGFVFYVIKYETNWIYILLNLILLAGWVIVLFYLSMALARWLEGEKKANGLFKDVYENDAVSTRYMLKNQQDINMDLMFYVLKWFGWSVPATIIAFFSLNYLF